LVYEEPLGLVADVLDFVRVGEVAFDQPAKKKKRE
jgi:hypothetical protein